LNRVSSSKGEGGNTIVSPLFLWEREKRKTSSASSFKRKEKRERIRIAKSS